MKLRETAIVSGGLLAQQATVFATGVLVARFLRSARSKASPAWW